MVASRFFIGSIAIVACLALPGVAMAEEMADAGASVPFISGGIGEDDLSHLKSVEPDYNLKLVFTETNGVFLSDLPVSISDKAGRSLVSTVTKGPIMLVKLPAGTYTIKASDGGASEDHKISLSGRSLRIYQFRFPGNDLRSPED